MYRLTIFIRSPTHSTIFLPLLIASLGFVKVSATLSLSFQKVVPSRNWQFVYVLEKAGESLPIWRVSWSLRGMQDRYRVWCKGYLCCDPFPSSCSLCRCLGGRFIPFLLFSSVCTKGCLSNLIRLFYFPCINFFFLFLFFFLFPSFSTAHTGNLNSLLSPAPSSLSLDPALPPLTHRPHPLPPSPCSGT